MTQAMLEDPTLAADGQFEDPLRRVAFQPGMLLGVEATRVEQDYHRRRLNRHQYWLHGYGTVAGLPVVIQSRAPTDDTEHLSVRVIVAPGIAIDGLGREVSLHEPYCINLKEWLEAHAEPDVEPKRWDIQEGGLKEDDDTLWLLVTLRQREVLGNPAPTMAQAVNAGTDPVMHTRLLDGVALELVPDYPPPGADALHPWGKPAHAVDPWPMPGRAHGSEPPASPLTQAEKDYLAQIPTGARELLAEQAELLFSLPNDSTALSVLREQGKNVDLRRELLRLARIPLARLKLRLDPGRRIVSNPLRIELNNLIRPFVTTTSQLASLQRGSGI